MTAPNPADPAWDAAVAAAAAVIYGEGMSGEGVVAEALTAALGKLGARLVSPDADTRTEWASEHSNHRVAGFPDPLVIEAGASRGLAETRVEAWGISHPHAAHRLLSRSTTTVFGPWVPVATPKES